MRIEVISLLSFTKFAVERNSPSHNSQVPTSSPCSPCSSYSVKCEVARVDEQIRKSLLLQNNNFYAIVFIRVIRVILMILMALQLTVTRKGGNSTCDCFWYILSHVEFCINIWLGMRSVLVNLGAVGIVFEIII